MKRRIFVSFVIAVILMQTVLAWNMGQTIRVKIDTPTNTELWEFRYENIFGRAFTIIDEDSGPLGSFDDTCWIASNPSYRGLVLQRDGAISDITGAACGDLDKRLVEWQEFSPTKPYTDETGSKALSTSGTRYNPIGDFYRTHNDWWVQCTPAEAGNIYVDPIRADIRLRCDGADFYFVGSCAADGSACSGDADCCSTICGPLSGTCRPNTNCAPDGSAPDADWGCCNLDCGGVCASSCGPVCSCVANSLQCSGSIVQECRDDCTGWDNIENCDSKLSTDTDMGVNDFINFGQVRDYGGCSAGTCQSAVSSDFCVTPTTLREYGPSGISITSQLKNCEDYEGATYCSFGRLYKREWGCSAGACSDAAILDVLSPTRVNLDGDAWDRQCGDLFCDNVAGVSDATRIAENTPSLCFDGIDNDCNGVRDCQDINCAGVTGLLGSTCCTSAANCAQDDCVVETCLANVCQYSARPVCDATECLAGNYCNAAGNCVDPDLDQNLCVNCESQKWLYGNETFGYIFGSYTDRGQQSCCGNEADEFDIPRATSEGCCDEPTDCIDSLGFCRVGREDDYALCTNGADDDCDGTIDGVDDDCHGDVEGYVIDVENSNTIQGALVKSTPPGVDSSYEVESITNFNGRYLIENAYVGNYYFIARKPGYNDRIINVTVFSQATVNQDFDLIRGANCKPDCTNGQGICMAACDGLNFNTTIGATEIEEECKLAHPGCNQRPQGFIYTYIDGLGQYNEIVCCEGPTRQFAALEATVSSGVDQLYDYTQTIYIGKRPYVMHILVWKNLIR